MIHAQTIYFWLVVTNLMALALFCWAGRNLPPSAGKRAFLLFIPCYLCWSNPLLVVQLLDLHGPYIRLMSQLIYAGGIVFMAALGYFILTIAAPAALNSIPFWLFQINYAVLFVLSFFGYIEGGIERMPDGTLQPLEGPLFRYFNWSMLTFGIYFLSMCGISYWKTKEDLLACQLKTIFWSGLLSFALLMVTNSLLPAALGIYQASPAGALWLLLFFAGVGYILVTGYALLTREAFSKLLKDPFFRSESNIKTLRYFLGTLRYSASDKNTPLCRALSFQDESGSTRTVYLSRGLQLGPKLLSESTASSQVASPSSPPAPWLTALKSDFESHCRNKVFFSSLLLESAECSSHEGTDVPQEQIEISKALVEIRAQATASQVRYGAPILAYSPQMRSVLLQLEEFCASPGAIVISGETGSGRSTLAQAAAHLRHIQDVTVIPCAYEKSADLDAKVAAFAAQDPSSHSAALILDGVDRLPADRFGLLADLFSSQFQSEKLLLLTVSPHFISRAKGLPYGLIQLYHRRHLAIPPLRERPDDIFAQTLWFTDGLGAQRIRSMDSQALRKALSHRWRGNSAELRSCVLRGLALGQEEFLSDLTMHFEPGLSIPPLAGTRAAISPEDVQKSLEGRLQ